MPGIDDLSIAVARPFAEWWAARQQRQDDLRKNLSDLGYPDPDTAAPPTPPAPAMFRPTPPSPDAGQMAADVAAADRMPTRAPGGITYSGTPDWAKERAGFLARGSDPRVSALADAMEGRRLVEENAASDRPDLLEDMRNQYALSGLKRAAQMGDPAYRREQAAEDAISAADTYMNPTVAAARNAQIGADVSHEEAMQRLRQRLGLTPEAQAGAEQNFQRQKTLHQIDAQGRSPLGALLAGQGGVAAPAAGGMVKMRAPDGSVRDVPAAQVDHFKSLGAQVVQ